MIKAIVLEQPSLCAPGSSHHWHSTIRSADQPPPPVGTECTLVCCHCGGKRHVAYQVGASTCGPFRP